MHYVLFSLMFCLSRSSARHTWRSAGEWWHQNNKNIYWFWHMCSQYFQILLSFSTNGNVTFLSMKRKTCFHFMVQEILYSSVKCNKLLLFLCYWMQMNIQSERAFQLSMFDIRQTWAGTRWDSQVQTVQPLPHGSRTDPRMF